MQKKFSDKKPVTCPPLTIRSKTREHLVNEYREFTGIFAYFSSNFFVFIPSRLKWQMYVNFRGPHSSLEREAMTSWYEGGKLNIISW